MYLLLGFMWPPKSQKGSIHGFSPNRGSLKGRPPSHLPRKGPCVREGRGTRALRLLSRAGGPFWGDPRELCAWSLPLHLPPAAPALEETNERARFSSSFCSLHLACPPQSLSQAQGSCQEGQEAEGWLWVAKPALNGVQGVPVIQEAALRLSGD